MDNSQKAYTPDLTLIQTLKKKWDECTDAERITKLREEARQMQYTVNRVAALEEKVRVLELHTHADGKVVVPVNTNPNGGLLGGVSRQNNLT